MAEGNSFGQRVRSAREHRGMTQDQLGEVIGYSASMVSGIENDRREIHVTDAAKLADALGVSVAGLLGEATGGWDEGYVSGYEAALRRVELAVTGWMPHRSEGTDG